MSKRITAREAQRNYIMTSPNVFEKAAAKAAGDKFKEIVKLVKAIKCRKGYTLAQAAPIAKRAYRMGVRSPSGEIRPEVGSFQGSSVFAN